MIESLEHIFMSCTVLACYVVQALLSPNVFNLGVPQYKLKGVNIQFKNMNIYVSGELQPYPATPTFT